MPVDRYVVAIDGSQAAADQPAIEHLLADGKLLWLDLDGTDPASIALLRDVFGVHPLAVGAASKFGQRPKIEDYRDTVYLVTYGARGFGQDLTEVHCVYSERFFITIHCHPCHALSTLQKRLAGQVGPEVQLHTHPHLGQRQPRLVLLYHLLDGMCDSYFPALSEFDDRIDALQEKIFAKPSDDQLVELFSMQRWLVGMRKLVSPQRDMMASLATGMITLPGMTDEAEPYVRDLYDRLIRVNDLVDSYRDLLSSAMDAYLSTVSNRLNQVMKQLTVIATVFLPLSFLTGFFGQNFAWMVNHLGGLTTFIVLGLGTEALSVVGLFALFRRRGWV
jgi:magnesium transporter